MRVELYSKRRCPLCEDAREALTRARTRFEFELVIRFIDDSPDAWSRFRYDVPVVFLDGERVFDHRVDEAELFARLQDAGTPVAQSPDPDA